MASPNFWAGKRQYIKLRKAQGWQRYKDVFEWHPIKMKKDQWYLIRIEDILFLTDNLDRVLNAVLGGEEIQLQAVYFPGEIRTLIVEA